MLSEATVIRPGSATSTCKHVESGCGSYRSARGSCEYPRVLDHAYALANSNLHAYSGRFAPIPASYSRDLQALVAALLQKQPDARPSMADILDLVLVRTHLRAYAQHIGLTCRPSLALGGSADLSSSGEVHSLLTHHMRCACYVGPACRPSSLGSSMSFGSSDKLHPVLTGVCLDPRRGTREVH